MDRHYSGLEPFGCMSSIVFLIDDFFKHFLASCYCTLYNVCVLTHLVTKEALCSKYFFLRVYLFCSTMNNFCDFKNWNYCIVKCCLWSSNFFKWLNFNNLIFVFNNVKIIINI